MQRSIRNPIVEQFLLKIRTPETSKKQFREAIQKIGEFAALQISKHLPTTVCKVTTVLGKEATHQTISQHPVLVTILRAGIPFHNGLQRIFSDAESGFIGAKRNEITLEAELSYIALPDIKGKVVIIADTMLATGGSIFKAIQQVKQFQPSCIIVATVIATETGINKIHEANKSINIFYACVDPKLNEKGYIVPGLGDAGDRSYGSKID